MVIRTYSDSNGGYEGDDDKEDDDSEFLIDHIREYLAKNIGNQSQSDNEPVNRHNVFSSSGAVIRAPWTETM